MNNKNNRSTGKNKGFYVALGICFIAIAVTAFMSYGNVSDFLSNNDSDINQEDIVSSEMADTTLRGIQENNKPDLNNQDNESLTQQANTTAEQNPPAGESQAAESQAQGSNLCIYPSSNTVLKEFSKGNPVHSITLNDWRVHDGTDFAADKGSIVKSITDGTVKEVYNDQSLGRIIVIEHSGGFEAYYCGLGDTTLVKPNDKVTMGQEIGSIKSVPCEMLEQDHLHLGIKVDGKWVNPMDILNKESESQQ